jgi:hypothetical protein
MKSTHEVPDHVRRRLNLRTRSLVHEQELRRAMGRLRREANEQFDVGVFIAEHAALILGGAFAIGLWVGARRPRY